MKKISAVALIAFSFFALSSCTKKSENTKKQIAVFIPGIMADSPI